MTSHSPATDADTAPRERLRLESTTAETGPNGNVSTTVRLEWDRRVVDGVSEGFDTRENVLRLGAEATVSAVGQLVPDHVQVELLGVKATRAFGTWVAMSYLKVTTEGEDTAVLGARALEDDDLVRGGAVAVLDALNRILAPLLD